MRAGRPTRRPYPDCRAGFGSWNDRCDLGAKDTSGAWHRTGPIRPWTALGFAHAGDPHCVRPRGRVAARARNRSGGRWGCGDNGALRSLGARRAVSMAAQQRDRWFRRRHQLSNALRRRRHRRGPRFGNASSRVCGKPRVGSCSRRARGRSRLRSGRWRGGSLPPEVDRSRAHVAPTRRIVVESPRPNERTTCQPGSGSSSSSSSSWPPSATSAGAAPRESQCRAGGLCPSALGALGEVI